MKRLTKTYPSGSYGIVGDIDDAVHRLAAIEDILGDEYDLERLKELIKQTGGAKPMRLIDADAIKINYGGLAHIGPYDYEEISKYYLDQIKKQPTVDAALVIRCRECKYGKNLLVCQEWYIAKLSTNTKLKTDIAMRGSK